MAEARLRSDVYEMGFAPLTTGGLEYRGLPGGGVIVYQVHDDLQETLFAGGPLGVGDIYENAAEGFSVQVVQAIDEGVSVRVTTAPDTRPTVPEVRELTPVLARKRVHDAGLVSKFTGQNPTNAAYVATQTPDAGVHVDPGSTVTMVLKKGPVL
jgi:hypothetical protein